MQKVGGSVWKNTRKDLSPYLGLPVAEEAYLFHDGRLYGGQLFIDGADNFVRARASLTAQFGNPDFANESLRIFTWKKAGTEIRLHYQAKFQRTTVHLEQTRTP
jgi:hypothetical protein